jgi:flavin-dependent dehydrogenase
MNTDYDLLIIGAGPAGCALALQARRAGLSVAILEQAPSPRTAPGETLHPGVEPLLAALGLRDELLGAGFLRHSGVWVTWDGPRRFVPYGEDQEGSWRGFQARRDDLNSILLIAARRAGASVRQACQATSVISEQGRVVGIETAAGVLRGRWVADASGWRHWLARELQIPIVAHSSTLFAHFGWTPIAGDLDDKNPSIMATSEGWDWTAPLAGDRRAWCKLRLGGHSQGNSTDPTPLGGSMQDVTWRCVRQVAGPGFFLLGDAAAVLDPASSHGVLKAIVSGLFLGHLISAANCGRVADEEAVYAFQNWTTDFFRHDASRLRALYACHPFTAVAASFQP